MKTITKKQLILALLKNDLINARLVYGLQTMGLDAGEYLLDLGGLTMRLMGFTKTQRTDELYHTYETLLQRVTQVDIMASHAPLDALALDMYARLREIRRK